MRLDEIIEDVVNEVSAFDTNSINHDGDGVYTVTINAEDAQYWHVGARVDFDCTLDRNYYGIVTAQPIPQRLIVTLDNAEEISVGIIQTFRMDLNYKHGHALDIFRQLTEMAMHKDYQMRRFPVIALLQDYQEQLGEGWDEATVTIILALDTKPEYTAAERYTQTFVGRRLLKLYERFVIYLEHSVYLYVRKQDIKKTDRLYWGREGAFGNEANVADDYIDAIEIELNCKILKLC
jgi:hypothetical protein